MSRRPVATWMVECRRDGPRLVAMKITLADAGEP